jgi:hypothetical protein
MSEPKWTSGEWRFVPREARPFGYQIMSGDTVISYQNAECVSSKQLTRADNLAAVGFRMREPGGFTTRDEVIAMLAEQDANGKLMAASKALYAALFECERELLKDDRSALAVMVRKALAKARGE